MLVVSDAVVLDLMGYIANLTHTLTDSNGKRADIGTIEDQRLRMAALSAMMIAAGRPLWPDSETVVLPRQERVGSLRVRE